MSDVRVYFATTKPNCGWAGELLESLGLNEGSSSIYYQPYLKDRVMTKKPKIYYAGPIWNRKSSMKKEFEKATALFCYIDENGIDKEMTYLIAYAAAHQLNIFFYIKSDCDFEIWDEPSLIAQAGDVNYVKDVYEAFERFVESQQPLITDRQFVCLDGLIKTVLPYFEILVNQEFSDCYDPCVLEGLSAKKAFDTIKYFYHFQNETRSYFVKAKRGETFNERVKRWQGKLSEKEVDCLFSSENKQSLSEMISFINEMFEMGLKDIETVEPYVKGCLDEKKNKNKRTKNKVSKVKSTKGSSAIEQLKYDGTIESEQKLIEILKESPERICSIENANETLWVVAIEHSPQLLRRKLIQTFKMIKTALEQDSSMVGVVSPTYRTKTSEEANILVKLHGKMLKHVPDELKTIQLCEIAIKQNGEMLEYVPNKMKTAQLCEMAIHQNVHAFPYVPLRYQTEEMCEYCVCVEPRYLTHVKPKNMTVGLCEKVMTLVKEEEIEGLVKLLSQDMSDEIALALVKRDGTYLRYLPTKKRKTMICLAAFEQTPKALEWIPKNKMTKEMVEKAMEYNHGLVRFVHKKEINEEVVLKAMNHNPELISCFDEKWLTEEIQLIYAKKRIFRWFSLDEFFNLNDYSKTEQLELIRLNPTLVFTVKKPSLELIIAAQNRFLEVDFIFDSRYEWFAFDLGRKIETECEIPYVDRKLVFDNLGKIERKIKGLY